MCEFRSPYETQNIKMKLLSPIEKSQTTLYTSTISTNKSLTSGGLGGDDDDDSDSDISLNECCDMTLVDDDDFGYDPKNEAEMMFLQVVEMLRDEQEVCS